MLNYGRYTAVGISSALHVATLAALALIPHYISTSGEFARLESTFSEPEPEETQPEQETVEIETDTEPELLSAGVVSPTMGGMGAPSVTHEKIEKSPSLVEPTIRYASHLIPMPSQQEIAVDLGEIEISGEAGAPVSGYEEALNRLTQEIIRMMREQRVHVVWLFDESESMKDDQREIRDIFYRVYEELGIAQKQDANLRRGEKILQTSIVGFGKSIHSITNQPTDEIRRIQVAIDKVAIDKSGQENMCQSVSAVIEKYGPGASRNDRKLVVVVVSDESPTDVAAVDGAIELSHRFNAPIYILGREAVFGYPYARIKWKDPIYGLTHWVRINRGPETPLPEALQYDGLHERWDSFSSGFGPYEQVRLASESGGIFFVLPGEEENLSNPRALRQRHFQFLAMKEYQPGLLPRDQYVTERDGSQFRARVWDVIERLNPFRDNQLKVRIDYSIEYPKFVQEGQREFDKVTRSMNLLRQAVGLLEEVGPLRSQEESRRWRANYDLIMAQCLAYRVRLFQFMLALDKHARDASPPNDKKSNQWRVRVTTQMIVPDADQFARIKQAYKLQVNRDEFLEEMQRQQERATDLYKLVESEHAGTPWAKRASYERRSGFGMQFRERFEDPRYAEVGPGKKIQIPNF